MKRRQGRGDKEEATRKRRQGRGDKEEATRRNPSQCGSRARSRRVAGDLSPWRRERRGACSGSLTIGSLTLKELYSTLFWPSLLFSKFLIIQVLHRLNHDPLLSTILPFSFLVFSSGWKVFLLTISTPYDFLVLLLVPLIGWEVFHQLISCPVFLLCFPLG